MPGVIYAINGVALQNDTYHWRAKRAGTSTQGGVTNSITKVGVPGRPGYKPAPGEATESIIVFNVKTPREHLDSLLALARSAAVLSRTDDPTKEAYVELVSAIPGGEFPLDGHFDVTITLSLYEGVWRDVDPAIFGAANITSPSQDFQMFVGIAAPVFDADVFIRGVFGEFTLTDSGGSFLKTTRAWSVGSSSNGLLYIGSTGQAFLANESNPWVPIQDMSQYVDQSGNGGFRLTPKLVSGNPSNRRVDLHLTTLTQTSTTLRVRAKRAYGMN